MTLAKKIFNKEVTTDEVKHVFKNEKQIFRALLCLSYITVFLGYMGIEKEYQLGFSIVNLFDFLITGTITSLFSLPQSFESFFTSVEYVIQNSSPLLLILYWISLICLFKLIFKTKKYLYFILFSLIILLSASNWFVFSKALMGI